MISAHLKLGFSLLTCLLTVAASGDDYCFVRLLFLPTQPLAEPLPLDDPNTDFVESGGPGGAQRSERQARGCTTGATLSLNGIALTSANGAQISGLHYAIRPDSSSNSLNTPLRC
jgi:hypothetical protein